MNHKDVYRLLIETWNTADFSRTPEWLNEDYLSHYGLVDQKLDGSPRDAFKAGVRWFRSATPDFVFQIKFMVEENDMLMGHWEGEGTHQGAMLGIEPTGKRFILRAEYKKYVVITNRDENDDIEEWKIGFSVFF